MHQALVGPGADDAPVQIRNKPVILNGEADAVAFPAGERHWQRQLNTIPFAAVHDYVANQTRVGTRSGSPIDCDLGGVVIRCVGGAKSPAKATLLDLTLKFHLIVL